MVKRSQSSNRPRNDAPTRVSPPSDGEAEVAEEGLVPLSVANVLPKNMSKRGDFKNKGSSLPMGTQRVDAFPPGGF